jgi:hypothetical protein
VWELLLADNFENVVTRDQTGMVIGHADARHPRGAIRIGDLNISGDKNALINLHTAPPKSAR